MNIIPINSLVGKYDPPNLEGRSTQNSSTLTEKGEVREMSEMFSRILRGVLSNPEMIVMLIAVCITMMVTLLLRRLSANTTLQIWRVVQQNLRGISKCQNASKRK